MIHHVAVETPRATIDASVAFYALLGFERVTPPDGLLEIAVWVQRDGQQVHLLFDEQPAVPPRGHLAVVCPDYAETVARLESAGFLFEPAPEFWGSPRGYAHDPAGHRVEVMQRTP